MMSASKPPHSLKCHKKYSRQCFNVQRWSRHNSKKESRNCGTEIFKKGGSGKGYSQQVLNFARAAQQTAQISEDKDNHIFKIISEDTKFQGKEDCN